MDPGRVFAPTLPLEQGAEGYRAMDERRAIKTAAPVSSGSPERRGDAMAAWIPQELHRIATDTHALRRCAKTASRTGR